MAELQVFERVEVDGEEWIRARTAAAGRRCRTAIIERHGRGLGSVRSCELIHCPDRVYRPSAIECDGRMAGIAISFMGCDPTGTGVAGILRIWRASPPGLRVRRAQPLWL